MTTLSRRDLIRMGTSLLACTSARNGVASPPISTGIEVNLAQEFLHSSILDLSPDGTKLCLEDWAAHGHPFRIVEIGTWRTMYTGRLQSNVMAASFFADSQTLFLDSLATYKGRLSDQFVAVDLRTGERTERLIAVKNSNQGERYSALGGRILLDAHYEGNPYRTETLALVEFPSMQELVKVPYATQPRQPRPVKFGIQLSTEYGFGISDDRRIMVYSFDNVLVCRRTEDLSVIWTRYFKPGVRAYRLALSADGSYVAAAASDTRFSDQQHTFCISVYDGRTGKDAARLSLSGTEGMSISPDGKLIAVVIREPGKKGEVLPTAHIYDVSSSRRLASVVHDCIKAGRRQFLEAGCTVAFTSDGKYMVTSGMATKVWTFGG